MRTKVVPVVVAAMLAALLALGGTAWAYAHSDVEADAKAGGKKVDSARGKGQQVHEEDSGPVTTSFKFNAKNLDGVSDEANGTVSFTNSQGSQSQSAKGSIECLRVGRVGGDKAGYFVFVITESSGTDPPPVGTRIGVNVLDTGRKHGKGDGALGQPIEESASCVDPTGEVEPLTKGNIQIKDKSA